MTKEEIKERYSMTEILSRYGIVPNRSGFVHCPFHKGDREPSMKVYKDSYHCFACGANGDIFDFVMRMDSVSFKEAFLSLGGSYENKETFHSKLCIYRAEKKKKMRLKQQERWKRKKELNYMLIDIYREWMRRSEPLSDTWCDCYNALQYQLYVMECLDEEVMQH